MSLGPLLEWLIPCGVFAVAFLLGSLPFGLWVARVYKVENIRERGSGNIGATNVARVAGQVPGALTLLLDALKGALAVAIALPSWSALWVGPIAQGTAAEGIHFTPMLIWLMGLAAVMGHCFSPWLRFKGGKGVATGLGAIAVLSPWSALVGIAAYALAFVNTRVSSVGSMAGLLSAMVTYLVLEPMGLHLLPGLGMVAIVLFRHEGNLDALLEDRERAF